MRKLRVKAIFFDLDGTIVDSKEAYLIALKTAWAKTGKPKSIDVELVTEIPKRLEQSLPINDLLKDIDAKKFLQEYLKAYYQATAMIAKPMPDISDILRMLSNKAKLALITMRYVTKEKVIEELMKFDLAKYFQQIITALGTDDPKPSPEALIKCANLLKVRMDECVVVGDSIVDIRAGKSCGARTVGVLSGIFSRQELERENPDLIIESVKELPDYLE